MAPRSDALTLERDGAEHIPAAIGSAQLADIEATLAGLPADRAGLRLHGIPALGTMLGADGAVGGIARARLGPATRPVRAILFDKSAETNWALGWHQDRTIAVAARVDTPDCGPWSIKSGVPHVAPPFALLASMLTLRVHLDAVSSDNAPLLIAPGSHRYGRVPEPELPDVVAACGTVACLAARGDVWVYATPILHASDAAVLPRRRRVLQVDYAATDLPHGLAWFGI